MRTIPAFKIVLEPLTTDRNIMSVSQHTIAEFQTKAKEALDSLANEFSLKVIQLDELTFQLTGCEVDIRLYLYPSHIPSLNIVFMPKGEQWNKWRQKSLWGATGIWLAHLFSFRKAKEIYPDTHFKTTQEMCSHIKLLICILHDVGNDLLRGNTEMLSQLIAYVDGNEEDYSNAQCQSIFSSGQRARLSSFKPSI